MNLELRRFPEYMGATPGEINIGSYWCYTLELPWKNNQHDISCIPKGTYSLEWNHSTHFKQDMYEIKNVPNRTGIRFHVANTIDELLGCIAICSRLFIQKDRLFASNSMEEYYHFIKACKQFKATSISVL